MARKRIACLLVGLGAVALMTALAGRQTQSATPDEFRFDAAKLKDKTSWTQVNTEPYYISSAVSFLCRAPMQADYEDDRKRNPHAATRITVYVNKVGRKAMFAKELKQFPKGSVIVKEKIGNESAGPTPLLYTIMRKREPGYNPAVGDWEFSVVSGDGTQLEASGKLGNCQACHIKRSETDFVFGPYRQVK
jgi:hypothetical protein